MRRVRVAFKIALAFALPALGGCAHAPVGTPVGELSDRDCLARAMYFESLRSSEEGMLAVGTTVMNRLDNPKFPKSVCGVVGQPHQYAPGALTSEVKGKSWARAQHVADEVLAGARHPQVGTAMYFHTVGWHYPYHDAHYVVVAGGNAFYEKVAPQYQHFVPNLAPEQPGHFEAPPVRDTAFAQAETQRPPPYREPPREDMQVAETDVESSPADDREPPYHRAEPVEQEQADGSDTPRGDAQFEQGPPRRPPYRRPSPARIEVAEAEPMPVSNVQESWHRRSPPRDREASFAAAPLPPLRSAAAYAPPPGRPHSIDDLLLPPGARPRQPRVSVAKLAPVQIHPFTD